MTHDEMIEIIMVKWKSSMSQDYLRIMLLELLLINEKNELEKLKNISSSLDNAAKQHCKPFDGIREEIKR